MNNWFNIALTISISIHIAIVGIAAYTSFDFKKNNTEQKREETEIKFTNVKPEQEKKQNLNDKRRIIKEPPPYLDLKEQLVNLEKTSKPQLKKPEIKDITMAKRKVVFNKPTEQLDSMPAYINYYEKIRNKIRKTAYSNYKSEISGKIFLNFTVNKEGELTEIALDQEQSIDSSDYLKNIALSSIRNSSPFPKFPKKLEKFGTLNFNLSIHFKRN